MKAGRFFQKHFDITYSRRSCIAGGVVAVLLLGLTIGFHGLWLNEDFTLRGLLFAGCLLLCLIIGSGIAFRIRLKEKAAQQCTEVALFFLLPIVTITMSEALCGVFTYDMTYEGFRYNYVLILMLSGLIFALSGSLKLSVLILNPLIFALSLTNHLMMEFRGTPFVPMDFLSITLADTILAEYTYRLNYQIFSAALLLIFMIVVGVRSRTPSFRLITRIISRVAPGEVVVVMMLLFFLTSAFSGVKGIAPDFWNQSRGYRNYGFLYSFFINAKYLYVLEPSGYDPDLVEKYMEDTLAGAEKDTPSEVQPDVICIMNESLADLSVLGEFSTNQECLPFISSLRENTVRGNLYVPVIGAGTSNTEFEFLTGNSMAFLPSGSNAYVLYANKQVPTIAHLMTANDYSVTAMHPYYARGWNRNRVYTNLGLDLFYSIEDLLDMDIFRTYQQEGAGDINYLGALMEAAYPGENVLLRQYVSDRYNYRVILEEYENREPDKPFFFFNVTMQNHGGYRKDADNFDQTVWLTDPDTNYPETDRFLSLMKHSDEAFEELIHYFEQVDRPVVICMFGDHQPAIEEDFVAQVLGADLGWLSLKQQQDRHITPFLIWANYDIEEQEIERLSANYLSSLLLKTAGLPMTEYNRYLLKLSETLPVINTVGYIDADGEYYDWNEPSPYSGLLEQYRRIQYNVLLDRDNRQDHLFTVTP